MAASDNLPLYCTDPDAVAQAVEAHVRRHRLLDSVARLGVAVSGGADSVALFHVLLPLCRSAGIDVSVLHLNHGLREAAAEEERFVGGLAAQEGLPFLSKRADLPAAPREGLSPEMAARAARMAFFRQCCVERRLDAVATGHQADDVVETLLLRLARGAGATGLSGLRPLTRNSHCTLIRPCLTVAGAALRDWLSARGLAWREDASNQDTSIPRNLVRYRLLPELEKTWPAGLRSQLCQSAELLREEDGLLESLASQRLAALAPDASDPSLSVHGLLHEPPALQRRILRLWLFRHRQTEAAGHDPVRAILDDCHAPGDWQRQLAADVLLTCRSGRLDIARPPAPPPALTVLPHEGILNWGDLEIAVSPGQGIFSLENGIGHFPSACTLNAAALAGKTLAVRSRQAGDRIAPTGLHGSKKIQDLFVDAKVPEEKRDAIPLLVCGKEIAWVPGYRVARRFAVPAPDAPSVRISIHRLQPK